MTAAQAIAHFRRFGEFYLDPKGHKELYKLIKRQAKIIKWAKYATTEACVMCDNHVRSDAMPKAGGCPTCHVWKLVQMINEEAERENN